MAKKNELTPEELEAQRQEEEAKARQEAEEARLKAEEEEAKAEAEAQARAGKPATPPITQNENGLLPLADLAIRHRVPTWQQAALHRFMQWEDGKQVSDAEYQAGLDRLNGRRMGEV